MSRTFHCIRLVAIAALASAISVASFSPLHAMDRVILQLNWLPSGQKVAPYIGREKGIFAKRNIDLEIRRGTGSADTLTKVATGAVQFGYIDIANIMIAEGDAAGKVKGIMSLFSKSPHAIITMTDRGINSLADLKGKTIATSPFSSSNLFIGPVLQKAGVDPSSVKIERVEAATLTPLLVQGRVDGSVLWSPDEAFVKPLAEKAGKKAKVLHFTDTGFNMYGLVVAASTKLIEENPDLVRRFVEAMFESHKLVKENPAVAAEALVRAERQLDLSAMTEEARLTNMLMFNEVSERDGFGTFSKSLLQDSYSWLEQAGQIKTRRPVEEFVDLRFIPK